jgi:hypothetical protein
MAGLEPLSSIEVIMKIIKIVLFLGTTVCSVSLFANGTDILHYDVTKTLTNDGVETNAVGTVKAHQNKQGGADNQQLNVFVSGLATNGTYALLANGDTNLSNGVSFTTDADGNAKLQYRSQGNGHGQGLGKGKSALPDELNPVGNITQLDVVNSSTQVVLTADMTMPDKLQYLIKRNLSTNEVSAALRIQATTAHTQFELKASGLLATNDYLLVVNDAVIQTNATDSRGKLDIKSLPVSGGILSVGSLQLWDASSNVVVSTTLP